MLRKASQVFWNASTLNQNEMVIWSRMFREGLLPQSTYVSPSNSRAPPTLPGTHLALPTILPSLPRPLESLAVVPVVSSNVQCPTRPADAVPHSPVVSRTTSGEQQDNPENA